MNKQKQIEDMANIILKEPHIGGLWDFDKRIAQNLYNAGYRRYDDLVAKMTEEVDGWKKHYESLYETAKATIRAEVAREIFIELEEEIEAALQSNYELFEKYLNEQNPYMSATISRIGGKIDALRGIYCFIEELKKKYGVEKNG